MHKYRINLNTFHDTILRKVNCNVLVDFSPSQESNKLSFLHSKLRQKHPVPSIPLSRKT